jgi:hypothetical protein
MKWLNLALLLCSLFLSGCALIDQYQCPRLNLYQMGLNDAENGSFKQNVDPKIQICKKYNPNLNAAQYSAGYAKGLKRYCDPTYAYQLGTQGVVYHSVCSRVKQKKANAAWHRGLRHYCIPSQGFELGRQGESFPDFCPFDLKPSFRHAYDKGHRLYRHEQNLKNELNFVMQKIMEVQGKININNSNMSSIQNGTQKVPDKKIQVGLLIIQNQQLQYELDRLTNQRDSLERQIADLQQE